LSRSTWRIRASIPARILRFVLVAWSFCGVSAQKAAAVGVKTPYPGFIELALATSGENVPGE
jgi:hypothetical protein